MANDDFSDDFSMNDDYPDLDDEFDDFDDQEGDESDSQEVDLNATAFPEITKRFETTPHTFFADPGYYKAALANEGDIAQRVHTILQKFTKATDPKDRSVFRPQLISAYLEMLRGVAKKVPGRLPESKKFLLRFGLLHPNFITSETRSFFAKLVTENELGQPVYYVDEWLKAVGNGTIAASTTDEVKIIRSNSQMKLQQLLERADGKLSGARALLKAKDTERLEMEATLQDYFTTVTNRMSVDELDGVNECYSDSQKRAINDIQETLKNMLRADRELNMFFRDYRQALADVRSIKEKMKDGGEEETVDFAAINSEFDTIRQEAKMTVGRQGNHFPILTGEYFHCGPNDVGFRENVISLLARIESIDPEAFCRTYKNRLNRIIPYVVLIPTYGDTGICWEPFDKRNRATSRGRIVIPMYPRNLYIAVLSAVADLRWQVAKEKASYHWMEEGLTGRYYQWFAGHRMKGNIKDFFIQDYIFWMTKESDGVQKLDKEVRGAFWRYMPFSQEVKEKLRNRSYVYQDLYQRDLNRAMSDGY